MQLFKFFLHCVCVCVYVYEQRVPSGGQRARLAGVGSLFSPCLWGSKSGDQAWCQVPSATLHGDGDDLGVLFASVVVVLRQCFSVA